MSIRTRPDEGHLAYAPERFPEEVRDVEVWPAWDELDAEDE